MGETGTSCCRSFSSQFERYPRHPPGFPRLSCCTGDDPEGCWTWPKRLGEQQPSPHRTMVEHVEEVRERMATIWPMVREHMAQTAQARVYNHGAQPREFAPGDKVLVLVPTSECKFLVKWNSPYEVIEKVGAVNYRVRQPGRRPPTKVYHINLLKKWVARKVLFSLTPPQVAVKTEPVQVPMGEQLTPSQRQDLQDLVNRNRDVFSAEAGHTDLIQHRIVTEPGKRVKLRPYRIPEAGREAIAAEVRSCPWERGRAVAERRPRFLGHPALPVGAEAGGVWQPAGTKPWKDPSTLRKLTFTCLQRFFMNVNVAMYITDVDSVACCHHQSLCRSKALRDLLCLLTWT
ncbi:hypothetical protein SKAU_G00261590 [Synaphobranchus kaupii]|uniref:Integrase p58-like C-terminal domain-containing protein n=1 Tax=Synaphobranchus kaupii TaxID=118154 RepID=A0A9Q1EYQ6_SYNKA|nr:hypothetical protein SKAU_G00261590 [Synaphobranchus kaupii]